jgi:membrane protein DedA with SNARE-associated domain/uncharacterized tellurite resistance protein B-like protein
VYLAVAAATLLENVFPPTPSDVIVALAGLLTGRGVTQPVAVFLVAWLSSVSGAVLMYGVSRRYGRGFFGGAIGRRLLTPEAIAVLEQAYLRFGIWGIFVTRLLPGFRSFVAPFAGIVNLAPARALLPMALASALWYLVITAIGVQVGAEWDRIATILAALNRALGGLALVLAVVLVIWYLRRRRKRPPHPLWDLIHRALAHDAAGEARAHEDPAAAAAATLLLQLARADGTIGSEAMEEIEECLRARWSLPDQSGLSGAETDRGSRAADTSELRREVEARWNRPARLDLLERLFRIAQSDGVVSRFEDQLLSRAATLLGLEVADLLEVRSRVGV